MQPLPPQPLTLHGGAGAIEALRDAPASAATACHGGTAIVAHPHPLFEGNMRNKVVQTIARAAAHMGYQALRFNFRGVGASAGVYDQGRGECDDLLAVAEQTAAPQRPLLLAGFSFGAFVAARAAVRLADSGRTPHALVLVGTACSRFAVPTLPPALRARTLVLHGESDDVVPLPCVLDWARPQSLPVTVLPAVGHFFHGQLPLLHQLVAHHLAAVPPV